MQFKEVQIGKIFTYEPTPGEKQIAIKVSDREAITIGDGARVKIDKKKRVEWPSLPARGYVGSVNNEVVIVTFLANTGNAHCQPVIPKGKGYIIPISAITLDPEIVKLLERQREEAKAVNKVYIISDDIIMLTQKVVKLAEALKIIGEGV